MGGAFDPPHLAHRALAESAWRALNLTELRIFPTGQAWHKSTGLSPAADRLAMAHLAFANLPGVVVDDAEQGVTNIVRGEDLLSSTARQQLLARLLGLNPPSVLHVPVVYDA